MGSELTFDALVQEIANTHAELCAQASRAINIGLTLRNWLIGAYLVEYEQGGLDRASYGDRLLDTLASRLDHAGVSRANARELRRYRQFYLVYPQIRETLSPTLPERLRRLPANAEKRETLSPELQPPPSQLLERLSFSHFSELLKLDNPLKRAFYEIESMRGSWSVRELRRQIGTLYFERSGLSTDKEALSRLVQGDAEPQSLGLTIRDPYVFEFLGLKPQEVMSESALEDALLDELQAFLLELGRGFCFEARQKRILIGDTHCFVDLVFYHRILKCHVLIELKADAFKHEHLGQLNTYVSWYAENEGAEGDNPPIGLLLCTQKDHALARYALAGMSNQLFVSKYELMLPDTDAIAGFLEAKMRGEGGVQRRPALG